MFRGARILVAPLDWGLGHAARCVPVINTLLEQGAVPVIGADGDPLALLREAFPALEHVRIPGMEIRYSEGRTQAWALARQFPRMLRQVREERRLLAGMAKRLELDAVISDQRFGLCSARLPSILITHQLFPFSPLAQSTARRMNSLFIQRFNRCWIPDHAAAPGLSGTLAHGGPIPVHARFIGPLSRFRADVDAAARYRVVAVVSGPEPQRTLLQDAIAAQLSALPGKHLLLTGKPGTKEPGTDHVHITGHLPTAALNGALLRAELIVSRTGYSTIMDLEALGRSALLVPTPGQPEQEYLGKLHARTGRFIVQQQHQLDIAAVLRNPLQPSHVPEQNGELLEAMTDLAHLIDQNKHPTR